MKCVFLLGNPEAIYKHTRHNIAWDVVTSFELTWQKKTKFFAYTAETIIDGEKVIFVRPTTYYNRVGDSLRAVATFYKLGASDVLVIHDDLALPFGTVRVRIGGSDAGNNGVKSINQQGNGSQTARLRIGIASEKRALMGDTAFVLGKFSKDEQTIIGDTIAPHVVQAIERFVAGEHQPTSHKLLEE